MEIKTDNLKGCAFPVYLKYPAQSGPQRAFIAIDLSEEEVWADSDPEIGGGVPMDVWSGEVQRVTIPSDVDGDALAEFLESERAQELIQRVLDGSTVRMDSGTWGHYRGELDGDAEAALEELGALAQDLGRNSVWDAREYLHEIRHEYRDRFVEALRSGVIVDIDREVETIETENATDEGNGRPLLLERVEDFVRSCLDDAREVLDAEDGYEEA